MKAIIAKMRTDWAIVEEDRIACGDWTAADTDELGEAVRVAVESKDANQITLWARWLADLSSIAFGLKLSGVTKRMREQAAKQKAEAKA